MDTVHRIFEENLERRLFTWAATHAEAGRAVRAAACGITGAVVSAMEVVAECVAAPLFVALKFLIALKRPMTRAEKDELIKELSS
jgi:hypothetical protein